MSTKQLSLFDQPRPIQPRDPNVPAEARDRLSEDCRQVLELLRGGPKTNGELADAVSHRFGGRLYDLRKAGCVIETKVYRRSGLAVYTLKHEPEGLL